MKPSSITTQTKCHVYKNFYNGSISQTDAENELTNTEQLYGVYQSSKSKQQCNIYNLFYKKQITRDIGDLSLDKLEFCHGKPSACNQHYNECNKQVGSLEMNQCMFQRNIERTPCEILKNIYRNDFHTDNCINANYFKCIKKKDTEQCLVSTYCNSVTSGLNEHIECHNEYAIFKGEPMLNSL